MAVVKREFISSELVPEHGNETAWQSVKDASAHIHGLISCAAHAFNDNYMTDTQKICGYENGYLTQIIELQFSTNSWILFYKSSWTYGANRSYVMRQASSYNYTPTILHPQVASVHWKHVTCGAALYLPV